MIHQICICAEFVAFLWRRLHPLTLCVCLQCHEKMTAVMKTEEGMGIEYDEDVVCDVCRSVSVVLFFI